MALYNKQNKIDDMHLEVQREVNSPERNVIKSIPTSTLLFVGLAAIGTLFFAINKGWNMNKTFFFVTVVGAFAILLAMNQKGVRLLTEQECKVELYQKLKFKQRHRLGEYNELPEGTLKIALKGRLRFMNSKPWKRQIGFSIINPDGLEHQYSSELNPYSGDIIAIYEGFFDPRDVSDITYVASPEVAAQRRYEDYTGKTSGR